MNGYIIYKPKNDADKGKVGEVEGYSTDIDIHILLPAAGLFVEENNRFVNKGSECSYMLSDGNMKIFSGQKTFYEKDTATSVRPVAVPK